MHETRPHRLAPAGESLDVARLAGCTSRHPLTLQAPDGWRDSPSDVGCALGSGLRSARTARLLTRYTLRQWGMNSLIEDAEIVVGELVANAVTHAAAYASSGFGNDYPSLRLLHCPDEVICAVFDSSDAAPVLKSPASSDEVGRGLHMVDALSHEWGWTPIPGGKAVWAVLSSRHASPAREACRRACS